MNATLKEVLFKMSYRVLRPIAGFVVLVINEYEARRQREGQEVLAAVRAHYTSKPSRQQLAQHIRKMRGNNEITVEQCDAALMAVNRLV